MTRWQQTLEVARWEFSRFVKWRQQFVGLALMVLLGVGGAFVGRMIKRAGDRPVTVTVVGREALAFPLPTVEAVSWDTTSALDAAAVLHRPRFAILDEPFSGLDPLNQELFLELVRGLRDAGSTVLFSAHQMPLVERLADRVFVMHRGRELLHGTTSALVAGGSLHDLYVERVRAANAESGVTTEVA